MSDLRWKQLRSTSLPQEQRKINWSEVVVEELLETNIISHKAMAILKEERNVSDVDPRLTIDLRHDKKLRASMHTERIRQSDVLTEAKRILKREEREKKAILAQNKLIECEIDKFQNHISGLRNMNKRLERITSPSQSYTKKKTQWHHIFKSKVDPIVQCGENLHFNKMTDSFEIHNGQSEKSSLKNHNVKQSAAASPSQSRQEGIVDCEIRFGPSLVVCGNQLNDNEIMQYHSNPLMKSHQGYYKGTVFDKIQQKFVASVKSSHEPCESRIRHPSPVENTDESQECDTLSPYQYNSGEIKNNPVEVIAAQHHHHNEANTGDSPKEIFLVERDQTKNAPGKVIGSETNEYELNEGFKDKLESHSPVERTSRGLCKQPATPLKDDRPCQKVKVARSLEERKLDLMSHAYTKWMRHICNQAGSKKSTAPKVTYSTEKERGDQQGAKEGPNNALKREEKIEQVLYAIKQFKETKSACPRKTMDKSNIRLSKSSSDIRDDLKSFAAAKEGKLKRAVSGSCKHRLKSQEDVIAKQKAKLMEQRKQIEELKLSQLQVEREKSEMQTHKALKYVLESGNAEVKAHARTLHSSLSMVDLCPGNLFVRNMEQRAFEQRQKKQLALERRSRMEEERQKKAKEAEEQTRKEEQEIIQKKHEELQEARRLEREAREYARKERERMITLERKADAFSVKRILRNSLHGLKKLVTLRKQQIEIAGNFYERKLMESAMILWKQYVELCVAAKMDVADQFYSFSLLRRCFHALHQEMQEGATRLQVAEDMYELRLQERVFHGWMQYTHQCHMHTVEKMDWANEFYCKNLLRRCLHHWQLLPSVAQQDREKERRKMAWRHKVQEMLPDFKPVLSSD